MNAELFGNLVPWIIGLVGLVAFASFLPWFLGVVVIREMQVGLVVKRFSSRNLPPGRLVALEDEAGYQAETLAPGFHFGFWKWQSRIFKVPVIMVPREK